MIGLNNFNIVLRGDSFPVAPVDLEDFDFLGRPAVEELRLPPVLIVKAGEFRLQVAAERFQVSVVGGTATADKISALQAAARAYTTEYAGRKSISAVGHNFAGQLSADAPEVQSLATRLVDLQLVKDILTPTNEPSAQVSIRFTRGGETRATLKLELLDADEAGLAKYDINFHYQVLGPSSKIGAMDAIDLLEESHGHADGIVAGLLNELSVTGDGEA